MKIENAKELSPFFFEQRCSLKTLWIKYLTACSTSKLATYEDVLFIWIQLDIKKVALSRCDAIKAKETESDKDIVWWRLIYLFSCWFIRRYFAEDAAHSLIKLFSQPADWRAVSRKGFVKEWKMPSDINLFMSHDENEKWINNQRESLEIERNVRVENKNPWVD